MLEEEEDEGRHLWKKKEEEGWDVEESGGREPCLLVQWFSYGSAGATTECGSLAHLFSEVAFEGEERA